MKKRLFTVCLLNVFLLVGCTNNTEIIDNIQDNETMQYSLWTSIYDILKDIVTQNNECRDNNKLFVDISILWYAVNSNWNMEHYLVTNWECFGIDERWNLNNAWWFGNIPTTIELSQDFEQHYNLVRYETAKDWSEYDSSTKEMFSDEAYKIRKDGKYKFINDKSLLEMAEEYFRVTIIPETENNFECKFCDKLRYYEPLENEDWKNNELTFNYVSEDNWNNTIYFGSDWTFKAEWNWDEWEWTRTFGKDENTVIVLNNNLDHVYDRYIITSQTENSLSTILEIIQRR